MIPVADRTDALDGDLHDIAYRERRMGVATVAAPQLCQTRAGRPP